MSKGWPGERAKGAGLFQWTGALCSKSQAPKMLAGRAKHWRQG